MTNANRTIEPKSVFDSSQPRYLFCKPDLEPGAKKYYEITGVQVTDSYIAAHGNKVVSKEQPEGQTVEVGDWILTKTEADGASQQWTMWDETSPKTANGQGAKFQDRWKGVAGKSGFFSPRSVPTPMVELPEGGQFTVAWGEVQGGPGSFLAKYGEGDYNIITAPDLVTLGYTGMDEASSTKLEDITGAL